MCFGCNSLNTLIYFQNKTIGAFDFDFNSSVLAIIADWTFLTLVNIVGVKKSYLNNALNTLNLYTVFDNSDITLLYFLSVTLCLMGTPHGLYTEKVCTHTQPTLVCLVKHIMWQKALSCENIMDHLLVTFTRTRGTQATQNPQQLCSKDFFHLFIAFTAIIYRRAAAECAQFISQLFEFVCCTEFHLMYLLSVWQQSVFQEIENSAYLPYW